MSEQEKDCIRGILDRMANRVDISSRKNYDDIVSDAIRLGIRTKNDFAKAMGCEPPHVIKTAASTKAGAFVKALKSLGFGDQ